MLVTNGTIVNTIVDSTGLPAGGGGQPSSKGHQYMNSPKFLQKWYEIKKIEGWGGGVCRVRSPKSPTRYCS